uniref:DUF1640 domain-containing protein n=1 Tax=Candidatus Kentrum sp. FW TaxID=2126338 RepID=A0A450TGI6_9GAMM|nr:MAG: hypothetical protein BECKFW1821C_GA0114237_100911 [Candidatus Kentron sp. FW]
MTTTTFDTLQFVKILKGAKFSDEQAEAISQAVRNAQRESDLATKADVRILESKIDSIRWILGIIVLLTVVPLIRNFF